MDQGLINMLTAIVGIGLAIAAPLMALMFVWKLTRAKPQQQLPLEELDEIHARLAEVDAMKERLLEVEERLDFAERLLERQQAPNRIAKSEHLTPV